MTTLTQERLKQVFKYDQATGLFVRLVRTAHRVKVGDVAGSLSNTYLSICIDGKAYYAHRLAWFYVHGSWPEQHTDHVNGVKTDNRIANLRSVTFSQNQQNRKRRISKARSGLVGAHWNEQTKNWHSEIKLNRKRTHLGFFDTAEAAHAAYLTAKSRLHSYCTETA